MRRLDSSPDKEAQEREQTQEQEQEQLTRAQRLNIKVQTCWRQQQLHRAESAK
jgi:hypothetical protein